MASGNKTVVRKFCAGRSEVVGNADYTDLLLFLM